MLGASDSLPLLSLWRPVRRARVAAGSTSNQRQEVRRLKFKKTATSCAKHVEHEPVRAGESRAVEHERAAAGGDFSGDPSGTRTIELERAAPRGYFSRDRIWEEL
jgi:hypothetical protein